MKTINYVSVDTILAKLQRDLQREGISVNDVVEWVGEAVQALGGQIALEPAIRFAEVKNFTCKLPNLLKMVIQIAKNNEYEGATLVTSANVIASPEETPDVGVLIDDQGVPIEDYNIAFYRPYFDLIGEFTIGNLGKLPKFTPVRLTNHTFFDTLVCKEQNWEDIYSTCQDEYNIQDGMLRFSFPTGQVAIAYLRLKVDCNGYPMIPDTYSGITAVTKYVTMKLMELDFYAGRQGSEGRLAKAESDWHWYCKQYGNEAMMPKTVDEWELLLKQRNYIIPRINRYENFFGNLGHTENRNFMH